jgi:magnesium chelatase family protein
MHAKVISATTIGVQSCPVEVEVDLSLGLVNFYIVGLPDTAIKESSKRIQSALKHCGITLPTRKITVNLAPADLKKEGTLFDLPIAIAILIAAKKITVSDQFLNETLFIGELSLDGSIRFAKGTLPIAYDTLHLQKKRIIVPHANAQEAALIKELEVIGVSHLKQLINYLRGEESITPAAYRPPSQKLPYEESTLDFADVHGHYQAKRALQVAAAGRHNILFIGPPGSGKTMLAKRLYTIMPPMNFEEILQTSKVYSILGQLHKQPLITQRPFRAPHHTISQSGLIGGGTYPRPGEITRAHNGILFLDELAEFKRDTLEALRQPLESQRVAICRANRTAYFPASFILVTALNPCPCGFAGDKNRQCFCTANKISRYYSKLSGPLLDRIDIQINVHNIEYDALKKEARHNSSSADLYEAVQIATQMQIKRFGPVRNGQLSSRQIKQVCQLTSEAEELIKQAYEKLHMSMRGYHKILKVARTLADLDGDDQIHLPHIQEAIMYRSLGYLE